MSYGYNGKILHVDLTTLTTYIEEPNEDFYRKYMGGGCLGAYYLLNELKPGIDPLSPENIIIFAPSVITGAPVAGLSRYSVVTKSPLTGGFLDSEAGGYWGPELKFCGYDAVVVKGKAEKPVYLWIFDNKAEIKDASNVWGKDTGEAEKKIREELNQERARMVLIGPAGENLVKYSCILNESKHINGRGGSGAVMGSKNLKAIVCRGTKKIDVKDAETVKKHSKWIASNYKNNPAANGLNQFGTSVVVSGKINSEDLPTYNMREGSIEGAENLTSDAMNKTIFDKKESCYACAISCKRVVKSDDEIKINPYYGGPEHESIAALGSNCGISDIKVVAKANELCNRYSLDTISTGVTISFAMECFEKGLLCKEDTDGIELKFGDSNSLLNTIEIIAYRKGKLGNLLAEGTKKAAEMIGEEAKKYSLNVKGLELAMHDPRTKVGLALGYALSPLGADHVVVEPDQNHGPGAPEIFKNSLKPLGVSTGISTTELTPEKVKNFVFFQNYVSALDSLSMCAFTYAPRGFSIKDIISLIDAITGWETSLWEVMKVGERRVNMARIFNIKEGFTSKEDKLPKRFFETLKRPNAGDIKIDEEKFENTIDMVYEMMNWDKEGNPRKGKLYELDLGYLVD